MEILFLLLVAIAFSISKGLAHRRQAKLNDGPTASLWWHIRQAYAEIAARYGKKNRLLGSREVERESARRDSMTVLNERLQEHDKAVGDAISNLRTRRQKKKISKGTHHHSHRELSTFTPKSSPLKIEASVIAPNLLGVLGSIRFIYAADDLPSERKVDVHAVDANYLKGYCNLRREIRTFRFDRIVGKITCLDTGEVMTPTAWKRQTRKSLEQRSAGVALSKEHERQSSGYLAVYFSGFRAHHRTRLERIVRVDARYKVRDTLDASVDILVAGPLTGERQLHQADTFNIQIVDEDAFLTMIGAS